MSNAMDDATRTERGISTDSPAASKKVFALTAALAEAGVRGIVLSLGRGRQDGSGRYFKTRVRRVEGVATVYLPFVNLPVLSELLTMFSILPIVARIARDRENTVLLFYNRAPAYVAALIFARMLGIRCALDLEDSEVHDWGSAGITARLVRRTFDALCSTGALLACRALASVTTARPVLCCYGVVRDEGTVTRDFQQPTLSLLLGGTVSASTGADLVIDAITRLRDANTGWAGQLRFEITGKGDRIAAFSHLANDDRAPKVIVHGRTTQSDYEKILDRAHVGLALKLNSGPLAHTTFPSKVVEFAAANILTVTTDISDVREVLGDGAIYLTHDDASELTDALEWIVEHRAEAAAVARLGAAAVNRRCSPSGVGMSLANFLFSGIAAAPAR